FTDLGIRLGDNPVIPTVGRTLKFQGQVADVVHPNVDGDAVVCDQVDRRGRVRVGITSCPDLRDSRLDISRDTVTGIDARLVRVLDHSGECPVERAAEILEYGTGAGRLEVENRGLGTDCSGNQPKRG